MEGSDWVALVAVIVAGVSAAGTILAIWVNYRGSEKRLEHEERMQRERLANERRQASRAEASRAYRFATEVERKINWTTIEQRAAAGEDRMGSEAKQAVLDAADAMELARAYGWDDVPDAAGKVLHELASLEHAAFGSVGLVLSGQDYEATRVRFKQYYDNYDTAIELFRHAINE